MAVVFCEVTTKTGVRVPRLVRRATGPGTPCEDVRLRIAKHDAESETPGRERVEHGGRRGELRALAFGDVHHDRPGWMVRDAPLPEHAEDATGRLGVQRANVQIRHFLTKYGREVADALQRLVR